MKINFISSDFCDEKRQMHFKRNKAGSIIGVDIDKVVAKVFCWLFHRYQVNLEKPMNGDNFVFNHVDKKF